MAFPKKCVEEFGTFVHLEFYSTYIYKNKIRLDP